MIPPPLAYWVHDLSPFIIRFGDNFGLRWYGMAYVLSFYLGYLVYRQLAVKGFSELKPDAVGDFILWTGIFGVLIGGRLGYMLFYDFQRMLADPLSILRIWDGGMASHGGILGILIFTFYYSRRHHLSWTGLGDNLVVVAPIGLFLVRIANFINGELYGRATSVPWAIQFPAELYDAPVRMVRTAVSQCSVLDPALNSISAIIRASQENAEVRTVLAGLLTPRHPSQLYEAALEGAVLFSILWLIRTRIKNLANGVLTGIFFITYALLRIIGELFREPDASLTLGLTRGQFLSLFMIVIGVLFILFGWMRREAVAKAQNHRQ